MANPAIPPPPAPPKTKTAAPTGERGVFNAFINAHKALKPYAGTIWQYANFYGGITPTQLAGLLWFESGGKADAKSSVGALGLGQIYDTKANPTNAAGVPFFRSNKNISDADKKNPVFAIRYAAWRMSGATQKYGSVDQAYLHDYNPGYTGSATPISSVLPSGYVGTPSSTIDTTAQKSATTSQVTSSLKDPWVVQTKGGFKFVNATNPPAGTVQYGGTPLTRSQYNQVWNQTYADTYFAYTGRHASAKEITNILATAPSVYTLANQLATDPKGTFDKSPVYKQHAPGLVAYARTVLGNNWKPSGGIIRQAIAQNWDQATFKAHLMETPAYEKGPEFKDNLAKMQSTFESIYGTASNGNPAIKEQIRQKTLAGWTPDEYKSWLIAQPAYKHTPAYQAKSVSFLSQLGLITGAVPTLTADQIDQTLQSPVSAASPSTPKAPTAPPAVAGQAPALVSEHGQGGGYR